MKQWDEREPWWTPTIIFVVLFALALAILLGVTP